MLHNRRENTFMKWVKCFRCFCNAKEPSEANTNFAENRDWTKHEDSNIIEHLTSQERIHLWSEWNASHVSIERKDHHGYVNFAKNYDEKNMNIVIKNISQATEELKLCSKLNSKSSLDFDFMHIHLAICSR